MSLLEIKNLCVCVGDKEILIGIQLEGSMG